MQLATVTALDYLQDILWHPVEQLLDNMVYWEIRKAEMPDESKKAGYLRKADSVNAVIKGIIFKIIPTLLTTTSALARLAFPASGLLACLWAYLWPVLLAVGGHAMFGCITYILYTPLGIQHESRKRKREDDRFVTVLLFLIQVQAQN